MRSIASAVRNAPFVTSSTSTCPRVICLKRAIRSKSFLSRKGSFWSIGTNVCTSGRAAISSMIFSKSASSMRPRGNSFLNSGYGHMMHEALHALIVWSWIRAGKGCAAMSRTVEYRRFAARSVR
jgi:hypothetical protein